MKIPAKNGLVRCYLTRPMTHRFALLLAIALAGCAVDDVDVSTSEYAATTPIVPDKEMVITDKSVIASPLETTYDRSASKWRDARGCVDVWPPRPQHAAGRRSR